MRAAVLSGAIALILIIPAASAASRSSEDSVQVELGGASYRFGAGGDLAVKTGRGLAWSLRVRGAGSAQPAREGRVVSVAHPSGLVQEFHLGDRAAELRFVVNQRPADGRDLVVEADIESAGTLHQVRDRWVWRAGLAAVTLSDVFAFDANGVPVACAMDVRADGLSLVVDGAALAAAALPVTVDPEIMADDFRISDMGPNGSTAYAALEADVAYNPTNNEYLVVWRADDDQGGVVDNEEEIYGQLLDANGAAIGINDFRISTQGTDGDSTVDAQIPTVAWSSVHNEYLVTWRGDVVPTVGDEDLYGQRVSAAGALLGSNFRISTMGPETATTYDVLDSAIAYNATDDEYLVVWRASDNTGALVAGELEIFGRRLSGVDGSLLGTTHFRVSNQGTDGDPTVDVLGGPEVAWDSVNDAYLVVWHGELVDGKTEIFGQRLDRLGAEVGVDFRISTTGGDADTTLDAQNAAITFGVTPGEFLVVWDARKVANHEEVYGQRISSAGALLGTDFQISAASATNDPSVDAVRPDVAWGSVDNEYMVTWHGDVTAGEEETWLRTVGVDGTTTAAIERITDMGGATAGFHGRNPRIAFNSRFDQYLVVFDGTDNVAPLVAGEREIFGQLWADLAYADGDSDTWPNSIDCNDAVPAVNPGATEVCNGVDDDCDAQTDEGASLCPSGQVCNGAAGCGALQCGTQSVGNPGVFPGFGTVAANNTLAWAVTLGSAVSAAKMGIRLVGSPSGGIQLGVYADVGGGPGVLLGKTSVGALAAGTVELDFATPLVLTAGNYFFALLTDFDGLSFEANNSNSTTVSFVASPFAGGLPADMTGGTSFSNGAANMYLVAWDPAPCDANAGCDAAGACTCNAGFFGDGATCTACAATCPAGQGETAACTASSDVVCGACAAGTFNDGTGLTCATCTATCPAGQGETAACTASSDGACGACAAGTFNDGTGLTCATCAACTGATFVQTACTAGADTVCGNCAANCSACTGPGTTECSACDSGYDLVGSACVLGSCVSYTLGGLGPADAPNTVSLVADRARASQFVLSQASTVTHIEIEAAASGASLALAIYADNAGSVGSLVAETGAFVTTAGIMRVPLTSTANLAGGTYWAALLAANTGTAVRSVAAVVALKVSTATPFASGFPAPFVASAAAATGTGPYFILRKLDTSACDVNASCAANLDCVCADGFFGGGITCTACDASCSTCTGPTATDCAACPSGYSLVGGACVNDNECALGTDNCSANAVCTDTAGSFTCACAAGYTGDGVTCTACVAGEFKASVGAVACDLCAAGTYSGSSAATACVPCAAGTVQPATGQTACVPCAEGLAQPFTNKTTCFACQPGSFAAGTGNATCSDCAAGTFSAGSAAGSCTLCAAGTAQANTGQSSCGACAAGSFTASAGQTACVACPAGRFQDQTGQTSCALCAAGSFQGLTGQISCDLCAPGTSAGAPGQVACDPCLTGSFTEQAGSMSCQLCLPGTVAPQSGTVTCAPCAVGTVQPSAGQLTCSACAAGTVQPLEGRLVCDDCVAGSFQGQTGQTICDACAPGSFTPLAGQTACTPCTAGTSQDLAGQTACAPCTAGTAQAQAGQTACVACAAGTAVNTTGALSCDDCVAGTFQDQTGQPMCIDCAVGTAQSLAGQASCDACPAGSFQDQTGQTTCSLCAAGTAQSATGQTACAPCAPGAVAATAGASTCDACLGGTVQPDVGQTACVDCAAGTVQSQTGQTACVDCAAGQVQPLTGQLTCDSCALGTFQGQPGQTACVPCAVGTFASSAGLSACVDCAAGSFADQTGMSQCTLCALGAAQALTGQTGCDACPAGQFASTVGQAVCVDCAPGLIQPQTGQSACDACAAGTVQPLAGQTACDPCPTDTYQEQSGQTACDACAFGYHAPAGTASAGVCASVCGDGQSASDEECDDVAGSPTGGDGCAADCTLEPGFTCVGLAPSVCTASCGTAFALAGAALEWDTTAGFSEGTAGLTASLSNAESGLKTTRHRVAIPSGLGSPAPAVRIDTVLGANSCLRVWANATGAATGAPLGERCVAGAGQLVADLTALSGQTVYVVLALDKVAGGTASVTVQTVAVTSDLDADSAPEFPGQAACDGCIDVDKDGFGRVGTQVATTCTVGVGVDCNDGDPLIKPDAIELCDTQIDENCNGDVDTADAQCVEDCANGKDDGGNGISDCADVYCQADPFCTNPCNTTYSFTTGGGFWTPSGDPLFEAVTLNGDGVWKTGGTADVPTSAKQLAKLNLELTVPTVAQGGPRPQAELVYRLLAEPNPSFGVMVVCINEEAACKGNHPTAVFQTGVNTQPGVAPQGGAPNYNDGALDHVYVDLSAFIGQTITLTVAYDSVITSTQAVSGLTLSGVVLGSDVDADTQYEGSDASCDSCWDGDFDGFGDPLSPDLTTCSAGAQADCDDTENAINPGAQEICTQPGDEDCNGLADALDTDACGVEDCANGVDDNQDGQVDCDDPFCAGSPSCAVCSFGFDFGAGGSGFVATDNDPDGDPATQVWEQGKSLGDGGQRGWATVLNGNIDTVLQVAPFVRAHLSRQLTVPAGIPSPAVEITYSFEGDAANTTDIFGVCFDVSPALCNPSAPQGIVAWQTTASTGGAIVTQVIPLDPAKAGQPLTLVFFFDTVDGANNAVAGAFVNDVLIRSDEDGDGLYEALASECDHCIDGDGDGYGREGTAPSFVSTCAGAVLDCDDTDPATKPDQPENCALSGDQNCNGLADALEPLCSSCGDGVITAGEQCDDGGTVAGDGCDASCAVEPGALVLSELHLTRLLGQPGEQWVELYNPTSGAIDLVASDLRFKNQTGQIQNFAAACTPRVGKSGVLPAGGYYVVSLGLTVDGLDADAQCNGVFQLNAGADRLEVLATTLVLDAVDFTGFACELSEDSPIVGGIAKARSLELVDPAAQTTASNDAASAWCLAEVLGSYSNSQNHFGSPGGPGACAELLCDGVDDDCDGSIDELLADADGDGVCDEQDCPGFAPTCTSLAQCVVSDVGGSCEPIATDQDGDCIPDCKDGCIDQDGDGYGVAGGLPADQSTCLTVGGQPAPDCNDSLSFVHPGAVEAPSEGGTCTNLVDDDCDGQMDCTDVDCSGTVDCEGESCAGAVTVACGVATVVEPITDAFPCGADGGADAVLRFTSDYDGALGIRVSNEGQKQYSVSAFAGVCTDLTCDAPAGTVDSQCAKAGAGELQVVSGETYFLVVDQVGDCSGQGSSQAVVTLVCAERCTGGVDEDADGDVDCADSDCALDAACLGVDFDNDGVTTQAELICGTDPTNPLEVPTADGLLNVDNDTSSDGLPLLNCVDPDDDGDGADDVTEAAQCSLNPGAKNDATIYPGAQLSCDKAGVDADCNGTYDTQQSLCGAKESLCGNLLDDDQDQKIDCEDKDCVTSSLCAADDFDGDGVSNGVELTCNFDPESSTNTPGPSLAGDLDGDSIPNCVDPDDDGDGAPDLEEIVCGSDPSSAGSVPTDTDGDSQCDAVDPDDDNDGFADQVEVDCNADPLKADSQPLDLAHDLDGDGICNPIDPDMDGDGWTNGVEEACGTSSMDAAANPTAVGLDVDGDKVCDALDNDDDNDGWSDDKEALCLTDKNDAGDVPADKDGDGTCDVLDADADADGWADLTEQTCGTDPLDPQSNPTDAGLDADDDKLCDAVDSDDDGDGWDDVQESECGSDPADAASLPLDLDADLLCNAKDEDDDGDGWPDDTEEQCGADPLDATNMPTDSNGDGVCDTLDPSADPDGDGWDNQAEDACGTAKLDGGSVPVDTDQDGQCDVLDPDDDNDGWLDTDEVICGTDPLDVALHPLDGDGDGACDAIDSDDDGDNVGDADEVMCGTDPLDPAETPLEVDLLDTDLDGQANCVDEDDDDDGVSDVFEAQLGSDPRVKDSDGDGLDDGVEDADHNGEVGDSETSPIQKDTDGDGLDDGLEAGSCYVAEAEAGCLPSVGWEKDSDQDGVLDGLEDKNHDGVTGPDETSPMLADTDGDGFGDGVELGCATDPLVASDVPLDLDGSGTCDGAEVDTDQDGVADGVETFCGTNPQNNSDTPSLGDLVDTDGDGDINCVDLDDDQDDFTDVSELACGTDPRDAAVTPTLDDVVDTDGDGMLDCADPDDDNDGLDDAAEAEWGSDPKDGDSDDDGLTDGQEVFVHKTNVNEADTDGDGIQDGTELGVTKPTPDTGEGFVPDADPGTVTNPKQADTDGDVLTDGEEDLNHNGRVDDGETDPNNPQDGEFDTDGDGLSDRAELNPEPSSECPDLVGARLQPTQIDNKDSDGDGLEDKLEVLVHCTDANDPDTDDGGLSDWVEIQNGTDPLDPSDDFSTAVVHGDNVFGCSANEAPRGTPWGALGVVGVLLVGLLVGRRRRGCGLLLAVLVVGGLGFAPETAAAQKAVGNVNIENFFPAGGRHRAWSVAYSEVAPKWVPYAHVYFFGERQSLRVDAGPHTENLVEQQSFIDLNLGIGLFDVLQVELSLPIAVQMASQPDTQAIVPVSGAGLSDLALRLRGTLLDNKQGGFGIGMALGATFPTGSGEHFRGDEGVGVLANAIFDFKASIVVVSLNAGVRLRTQPVEFLGNEFGNELTYGFGVGVDVVRNTLNLAAEVFGRTPLNAPFQSLERSALEVLFGPKWDVVPGLGLHAAVGAGLVQGYGTPDFRFLAGVTWSPTREDTDGDGVDDADDECPLSPEDRDGWADLDGCPDLDNDHDSVLDLDDKCPNIPEDKNGIDDEDGCPDGDADGDGILDGADRCPNEAEDKDAWQDGDGCPDPDNDGDGFLDAKDKCPNQPETVNGFQDEDGCADEPPPVEVVVDGPGTPPPVDQRCRWTIVEKVYFTRGRALVRGTELAAIKRVARAIKAHPEIVEVAVDGHASQEGSEQANLDLSAERARAVRARLAGMGVARSLMVMRAFGEWKPTVDMETEAAYRKNRRVEFRVTLGGPCKQEKVPRAHVIH